jgi:uncharacterized protein
MVSITSDRLKLNTKELPDGEIQVELECAPEAVDLPERLIGIDGKVACGFTIYKSGDRVDVRGTVSFECVLVCSRCLKEYRSAGTERVVLYCRKAETRQSGGESELSDEDVMTYYYRENIIDLTSSVRDAILLSVPMKPLCSPECKGLCPVCGKDLNIERCSCTLETADPRWDALRKLKRQ